MFSFSDEIDNRVEAYNYDLDSGYITVDENEEFSVGGFERIGPGVYDDDGDYLYQFPRNWDENDRKVALKIAQKAYNEGRRDGLRAMRHALIKLFGLRP